MSAQSLADGRVRASEELGEAGRIDRVVRAHEVAGGRWKTSHSHGARRPPNRASAARDRLMWAKVLGVWAQCVG